MTISLAFGVALALVALALGALYIVVLIAFVPFCLAAAIVATVREFWSEVW